jgi:hypothetical protein
LRVWRGGSLGFVYFGWRFAGGHSVRWSRSKHTYSVAGSVLESFLFILSFPAKPCARQQFQTAVTRLVQWFLLN